MQYISQIFEKYYKSGLPLAIDQWPVATALFTFSDTVAIKVYHCANDDGSFDGQHGLCIHSVKRPVTLSTMINLDGDGHGGIEKCKQSFEVIYFGILLLN